MFSGPYMIQTVNHTITPGNFETTFEGIRQPTASLPLVENYIQSLKTSLLQTIIETNNQKKVESSLANAKGSKTNVKGQSAQKVTDNTNKGVTKPQNNQECPPNNKYNKFTPETPTGTTATYKEVIELINSKISGKPKKLGYAVFAKMYLNSNNDGYNLKTQSNNYSGTDLSLQNDWGQSGVVYFTQKQYYCGSDGTTIKPYVIFENLSQNIDFLISRFENRISKITDNHTSEITKFIILYSDALISKDNVYTTMNPTAISNIEYGVSESIKLYNQILGDFNIVI
jgi:hypothetical protein